MSKSNKVVIERLPSGVPGLARPKFHAPCGSRRHGRMALPLDGPERAGRLNLADVARLPWARVARYRGTEND